MTLKFSHKKLVSDAQLGVLCRDVKSTRQSHADEHLELRVYSPGGEEEEFDAVVLRVVELVDELLSVLTRSAAVKSCDTRKSVHHSTN